MTLDQARDAFEANPTPETAKALSIEAATYYADGIIALSTWLHYRAICEPLAPWQTVRQSAPWPLPLVCRPPRPEPDPIADNERLERWRETP